MQPFPEVIDNSMRSAFARCSKSMELSYIDHWKPKVSSIHLHAGKAFAAGCEVARYKFFVEGVPHEEAVAYGWERLVQEYGDYDSPEDGIKTLDAMSGALAFYFDAYDMRHDFIVPYQAGGKHLIEFSATVPIDVKHPTTGQPILYYGRFDMLGQHADGSLWVVDEKTTKQLGNSWVAGWDLDSQFTGYCFLAKKFDLPVVGALIRGVSILKRGYGTAQSIQTRPTYLIDRWYKQLCHDVERMIASWKSNYFDYSFGPGCKMYGGCHFKDVCRSDNSQRWLEADFEQQPYRPWENV